ncbi:uncharacterized protein MELLADRAFT_106215 [Melampsora larici-populina 98AG31]|uniref:Sorting nexin MVP1 n=1 Tax=Melampsora larici-populina (strain 98AG31 / pathotype 3-4-7) TaxID=747676 RepID=F4RLF6_MELLP|nr:uncharacterized protein MELLADRAFT_106215 [Melampsora larici-populina 98AG31]EGG07004.1 hypothetical protein MELLADRAFT_106215 [Melampsora larici-populina 98AG31]
MTSLNPSQNKLQTENQTIPSDLISSSPLTNTSNSNSSYPNYLQSQSSSTLSQSTPELYAHDPWSSPTHLTKTFSSSSINEPFTLPNKIEGHISEAALPNVYHQAFNAADPSAGTISLANAHRVLASSGVGASTIERILSVTSDHRSSRLTKSDFSIALAAVAFSQQGKPPRAVQQLISRNAPFPIPTLDFGPLVLTSPARSSYNRRSASPEDPWSSSTIKSRTNVSSTITNGLPFVVEEQEPLLGFGLETSLLPEGTTNLSSQFLPPFDRLQQDLVTVRLSAPEGWILKYNVYSVDHEKKGTSVPRRYSDFVWLHECLLKRYPFRLVPGLPPKRIAISGHHLATGDETAFIERRRRGLQRFLTYLVNHPVLSADNILSTFLCEPSDLATWRSHSTVHLIEESAVIRLTPAEEMSIPEDLDSRLSGFRSRLPLIVEHWSRICAGLERVTRRYEAQAADFTRIQLALGSAVESERTGSGTVGHACWRPAEARRAEDEIEVVAHHVGKHSDLLDRRTRRLALSTNEEVRAHRELYTDFGGLFNRLDKLSIDDVDKRLKPRAEMNSKKLEEVRNLRKSGWEEESDKLRNLIEIDRAGIESKLRRRVFIRWCLWQEWIHLMRMGSLIGKGLREFVDDERRFGERALSNWGEVSDAIEGLVR